MSRIRAVQFDVCFRMHGIAPYFAQLVRHAARTVLCSRFSLQIKKCDLGACQPCIAVTKSYDQLLSLVSLESIARPTSDKKDVSSTPPSP